MGKELDGRSDLYSFGITFYEMLTGRFPIPGNDFASLVTGHLYRPFLPFDEADPEGRIPPELRKLVERSLHKDPNRRWSSAAELSDALVALDLPRWNDPGGARLAKILTGATGADGEPAEPYRGSTQTEIDRHFDQARATPTPDTIERLSKSLPAAAPEVAAPETAAPGPAVSIDGIRAALERGDVAEATRLLASATDEELVLPEMRAVRHEIERQMAAREAARRGAREPDGDSLAWADSQLRKLVDSGRSPRGSAPAAQRIAAPAELSGRATLDEHARQALEGGIDEAERLLRMGDTQAAARVLDSVHARTAVWDMPASLQLRYRTLDDETRSLRLAAHLARAAHLLEVGSAIDAEYELEQARAIDRTHPAVAILAERIQTAKADTHASFRPAEEGIAGAAWSRPFVDAYRSLERMLDGPPWLLPLLLAGMLATAAFLVTFALL